MSYDAFLAEIGAPALRRIAAHWQAVRGDKHLPAWKDIDPLAIARDLPIVWSWQYDRQADSFTGRLSGEDINKAFGRSLRGVPMQDFFRDWEFEKIFARHRRVVTEPCFAHGSGPVFIHAQRYGDGERIILPLADDGVTGDGIIGATVYRPVAPSAQGQLPATAEEVSYYPL